MRANFSDSQFSQYFRRTVWREAGEKPLNRHFCMAVGSADAAEIAQVQRIAPVMPPLHNLHIALANMREHSAENAAIPMHFYHRGTENTEKMQRRELTQGLQDSETQLYIQSSTKVLEMGYQNVTLSRPIYQRF